MKYYYYNFIFMPISKDLGTKHTRTFKATNYENALKQARKEATGFKQDGKQVYELDLTTSITCRADLEKVEAGALIIIENKSNGYRFAVFLNKDYMTERGYMTGGCLYPYEWLKIADESDYLERVVKLTADFNKSLDALKNAYSKAKKYTRG